MSYRERLIELQLFPLMYYLDLQDVLFLLKCIKYPPDNFDVFSYISFCKSNSRSSSMGKLKYVYKWLSTTRHFYFNRVVRIWNQLPFLDLTLSFNSLKSIVIDHLWNHLFVILILLMCALIISFVRVIIVILSLHFNFTCIISF